MSIVYHADKGKPLTSQEVDGNFATIAAMATGHSADRSNPHAVTKAQVGLGAVDNTPDLAKPVSAAQAEALALKASAASLASHTGDTANPHAVTKAQVGLGNCNNTSDANKPISTAQQSALDLKANLASPEFSGSPSAPTAEPGANTPQIANTAFVQQEISSLVFGGMLTAENNLSDLTDVSAARNNLGLGGAAVMSPGTSGGQLVQLTSGAALPAISGANLTNLPSTGNDLAVRNAFRLAILGTDAASAIPDGWLDGFGADTLATKAGATYDAAGDYYSNLTAGGLFAPNNLTAHGTSEFASDELNSTYASWKAFDGADKTTSSTGWQSNTAGVIGKYLGRAKASGTIPRTLRIWNSQYSSVWRMGAKDIVVEGSNDAVANGTGGLSTVGTWTKIPVASLTGGSIINTDEARINQGSGDGVAASSVLTLGGSTAYKAVRIRCTSDSYDLGVVQIREMEVVDADTVSEMTLIPTAFTSPATTRLEAHFLHKAIDAVTLNTDLKARATANDGTNWSSFGTIESLGVTVLGWAQLKVSFTELTSGTAPKVEITTANAKAQQVRGLAMLV